MKIMLICLTRRGGLLHFNDCLAESLGLLCETALISSSSAERDCLPKNVTNWALDTGSGKKGTALKLFSPSTWSFLRNKIKDFQPDVIHITSAQEWNPALGFYFRFLAGKPLAYTVHDVIHHEGTPGYFRLTESIFRKLPPYMVTLSNQGKAILEKSGVPSENILVVPHGVYDFFTQYANEKIAEEKEILFFGRIEQYKGLQYLLEAIPAVFEKHPDWRLHVAGGGDISPYASLLTDKRISVTNRFISDAEVATFMQRASIVALPYLSASQSGVIPTAFAFGKAVVATNVGSIPDMVQDHETGLLIPPMDTAALRNALNTLIEQETLRKKLAANGLTFANENLGWKKIAEQHCAFYQKILKMETA